MRVGVKGCWVNLVNGKVFTYPTVCYDIVFFYSFIHVNQFCSGRRREDEGTMEDFRYRLLKLRAR